MIELKHSLIPFSPTGQVFDKMLRPITPPGPPVYNIAFPDELGFPERQDTNHNLSPSEINQAIFEEGMRLAGADRIDIGNGKEILVFNTSVASTHTLLTVQYDQWKSSFREQAKQLGFEVPNSDLIHGRSTEGHNINSPTHVPLDMVTWTMVYDTNSETYWPCDINDLTSLQTGDGEIDKFKLNLNDNNLKVLNELIIKRNRLAINTLLDLHNNILCTEMPFLRTKTEEDLLIGALSGYYRGDEAKNLDQFKYDHRGKGPMSNPTLHFRITDHFTMKDGNLYDQENPSTSFLKSIQELRQDYPDYFNKGIDFLRIKPERGLKQTQSEVLADLMSNPDFTPYDLIKSVDPFGSLAHEYLGSWLKSQFESIFTEFPHTSELFAHHTEDYERELRVSEGITFKFSIPLEYQASEDTFIAKKFTKLQKWIGQTLYPMWEDINSIVVRKLILTREEYNNELIDLQQKYDLPDPFINGVRFIKPTEKQLKLLREEEEHKDQIDIQNLMKLDNMIVNYQVRKGHIIENVAKLKKQMEENNGDLDTLIELLTWIQSGQLFDYEKYELQINQGYNISGTPGTAITYHFDKDHKLNLNIGWVLSTKGLSELWLGTILKRKERRDR